MSSLPPLEQSSPGQQANPEGLRAGSQPLTDVTGSDGLLTSSRPFTEVKKKRNRGGRIVQGRREAELRTAARKSQTGTGKAAPHESLSRAAAAYAKAAKRATSANAEAHRTAIAHLAAAQAATGLPEANQVKAHVAQQG